MSEIKVELQECMGSDFSIANAAWTSTFDKAKRDLRYNDDEKISNLVKRLAKEGHATPFESVVFRFWIRLPIYVDRQHMTHRIASHNGLSGRYRTAPTDWIEFPEDLKNIFDKIHPHFFDSMKDQYNYALQSQAMIYISNIEALKQYKTDGTISDSDYKRCREIYRSILGTAFMTERTTVINLRSFCNYQKRRNHKDAQKEIQVLAQLMLDEVKRKECCPIAIEVLEEIDWKLD